MANNTIRCLMHGCQFNLAEALIVPIETPASPGSELLTEVPSASLGELPLGYNRVCPTCRFPLTYAQATGQLSLHPIAIAGGPGVSKSHYIPVLIDQLKRRLTNSLRGFNVLAQETRGPGDAVSVCSDVLQAQRYGRLFADDELGTEIAKTDLSKSQTELLAPLIYRFGFPSPWEWLTGRRKCVEFAFRDCAGEEFLNPGSLMDSHRYITHAAGILLLIDPTTIPGLRERLPSQRRDASPHEADQIISSLVGLCQRAGGRIGKRLRTPLAIVLTKADLLRNLIGNDAAPFHQAEPLHRGGFDHRDFVDQQPRLRRLLTTCAPDSILSSVDANFSTVGIFAVSALGHAPFADPDGGKVLRVGRIQPWRVLDPLMWLFHHHGFVGRSKEKTCSS